MDTLVYWDRSLMYTSYSLPKFDILLSEYKRQINLTMTLYI